MIPLFTESVLLGINRATGTAFGWRIALRFRCWRAASADVSLSYMAPPAVHEGKKSAHREILRQSPFIAPLGCFAAIV